MQSREKVTRKTDKPTYPSLYGLRAVSIILVMFHHFGFPQTPDSLRRAEPFFSLFHDGQLGVNVFFVISGFLITSLLLQEQAAFGKVSLREFYIRRTLRIFPAYYFLLLFYAVLQLAGVIQLSGLSWLTSLTYTKYLNWFDDRYTPHAWSLSIEEQFYLVWPPVFVYAKRFRVWMLVGIIAVIPWIKLYDHFDDIHWITELSIFYRLDAIAIGCLAALYKDRIVGFLSKQWVASVLIAVIVLTATAIQPDEHSSRFFKGYFVTLGSTHGLVGNLAVTVIVLYSVFGPKGLWYKLMNLKPLVYIGLLSYSIYLWQQFFAVNSDYWFTNMPWEIGGVLVCALFSYYVIERPFLKLKSRFSRLLIKEKSKPETAETTGVIE